MSKQNSILMMMDAMKDLANAGAVSIEEIEDQEVGDQETVGALIMTGYARMVSANGAKEKLKNQLKLNPLILLPKSEDSSPCSYNEFNLISMIMSYRNHLVNV
jgi:hypothetical protein